MTRRKIRVDLYGWEVMCFVGYDRDDAAEICDALEAIGCRREAVREAYHHLTLGSAERGLTYSNVAERKSVVAVGASDAADVVNTIGHELLHVVAHICEKDGIDMLSEEPCYILGQLCEDLFNNLKEEDDGDNKGY